MSRADGILDLVVKAAPYRDILSGIKPEEYRNESWAYKLFRDKNQTCWNPPLMSQNDFHDYHTARISLGYASNRPSHLRKIRGIRWGAPNPAWCYGIVTAEKCFIIELGEIIA